MSLVGTRLDEAPRSSGQLRGYGGSRSGPHDPPDQSSRRRRASDRGAPRRFRRRRRQLLTGAAPYLGALVRVSVGHHRRTNSRNVPLPSLFIRAIMGKIGFFTGNPLQFIT